MGLLAVLAEGIVGKSGAGDGEIEVPCGKKAGEVERERWSNERTGMCTRSGGKAA